MSLDTRHPSLKMSLRYFLSLLWHRQTEAGCSYSYYSGLVKIVCDDLTPAVRVTRYKKSMKNQTTLREYYIIIIFQRNAQVRVQSTKGRNFLDRLHITVKWCDITVLFYAFLPSFYREPLHFEGSPLSAYPILLHLEHMCNMCHVIGFSILNLKETFRWLVVYCSHRF